MVNFDELDLETLDLCLRMCDAALLEYKGERTSAMRKEIAEAIRRKKIDPKAGMRLSGADGKKYGY